MEKVLEFVAGQHLKFIKKYGFSERKGYYNLEQLASGKVRRTTVVLLQLGLDVGAIGFISFLFFGSSGGINPGKISNFNL